MLSTAVFRPMPARWHLTTLIPRLPISVRLVSLYLKSNDVHYGVHCSGVPDLWRRLFLQRTLSRPIRCRPFTFTTNSSNRPPSTKKFIHSP